MELLPRLETEMVPIFAASVPLDLKDLASARQAGDALAALGREQAPDSRVRREDHFVPGWGPSPPVRIRHYFPATAHGPVPCLYWVHGGGFVMGRLETDDPVLEHIVAEVGCAVVSVEWRYAPEHPYPASLDDAYAGVRWLIDNSLALGIDPTRIAIGGKSSGGGTAAGLCLRLRDEDEFVPCFQVLLYPMLDDRNVTPSSFAITDDRVWNRDANTIAWRAYLGDAIGSVPAYAAPARADDLSGLPPTFIAVGDLDLFLDEDIEFAQRLLQAEIPTELHVYQGAIHGFEARAPLTPLAARFRRDRDDALRRAFAVPS